MLTRRGWLALVLAGVLGVGGRILGAPELYVLAGSLGALVAISVVYVRFSRLRQAAIRQVHPTKAHVGTPARVELEVRNTSRRRSGVVALHDEVSGTRGASIGVPPLPGGDVVRASYVLPTVRRGVLGIGPLVATRSDPFDLVSLETPVAGTVEITVYPHTDPVAPTALTTGNDPLAGAEHPDALGGRGEDFYALRPYVVGDDLRRVHWPSTARHGDLMIRQDEMPWQGRVTLLLDDRPGRSAPEVFEGMVSAAASIVAASARRQDLLRMTTATGADTGFGNGQQHVESIMELLATVDPAGVDAEGTAHAGSDRRGVALEDALAALKMGPSSGALVAVVGAMPVGELAALQTAGGRFGAAHVVRFLEEGDSGHRWGRAPESAGRTQLVDVSVHRPFPIAWDEAMLTTGSARHRRRTMARPRR